MPLYFPHNLYRGVNAHLHSYFQTYGGWQGFHNNYIALLSGEISRHLPPGYIVDTEQSLQIRESDPNTGTPVRVRRPEPDLTIYHAAPTSPSTQPFDQAVTLTVPIMETLMLPEDLYLSAIVIYEVQDDVAFGKPITQIEVFSPTNKPPGEGYEQYRDKRYACLKSGLKMVEIDYLHETLSPIGGIPSYRAQAEHAFPYYIAISDPYPSIQEKKTEIYGFHVDIPIPILNIPLAGQTTVQVDFGHPYHQTFELVNAYAQRVDYMALPAHFDTYTPADQERIKQVMARAQATV